MIMPPEQSQIDDGVIPLERTRGNLDVASISVSDLLRYMARHRIPLKSQITAAMFHDAPHLEIILGCDPS